MEASVASVSTAELSSLGLVILRVLSVLRLAQVKWGEKVIEVNNLTLINFVLIWAGPLREDTLVMLLLVIQVRAINYLNILLTSNVILKIKTSKYWLTIGKTLVTPLN